MATHSSVLAWRVPGTGEPGGLPSLGSHRVRHNWSNLAGRQAGDLPNPGIELDSESSLEERIKELTEVEIRKALAFEILQTLLLAKGFCV